MTKPLKSVGIVSGVLHPKYGGPVSVIQAHHQGLSSALKVKIFGVADQGDEHEILRAFPGAALHQRAWPNFWFRGTGLSKSLLDASGDFDLLHAHMFWDHTIYATWKASKASGCPFVVTPHGSLVPSPIRYKGLDKKIYKNLILDQVLSDAACVHVLNDVEKLACEEYGIKCPIQVIPNGLPAYQFDNVTTSDLALNAWPILRNRRVLLYMGRLWSGKGLDILPAALAKIDFLRQFPDWILVLAGPDYRGYKSILVKKIYELGLSDSVLFTGHVSGDLKSSLLATCDFFILPSHAEGFSMALLEAAASARPALISPECNMPDLAEIGGAWVAPSDLEHLAEILRDLLVKSREFFDIAGKKAWEFTRQKYTLESVIESLKMLYNSVK